MVRPDALPDGHHRIPTGEEPASMQCSVVSDRKSDDYAGVVLAAPLFFLVGALPFRREQATPKSLIDNPVDGRDRIPGLDEDLCDVVGLPVLVLTHDLNAIA